MGYTVKLEERELNTIAQLLAERLEDTGFPGSAYQRRSLVRLVLVLHNLPDGYGQWNRVIAGAPRWVFQYLGKPVIDLTPAPKPTAKPTKQKKAARRSPAPNDSE